MAEENLLVDLSDDMSSVEISTSSSYQLSPNQEDIDRQLAQQLQQEAQQEFNNWPPTSTSQKTSGETPAQKPVVEEAWVDPAEEYEDIAKHGIVEVSGSDVNGRPVIVVSACKLPPTKLLDHKRFLNYLKLTLDRYVEADYSLVYLHHGLNSSNKPSFTWLMEAYREFDRKYKKNLKTLYIIHPSTFIKILFNVFKPVISAKFGRKVKYCNYLSDISDTITLSQIPIPDKVKEYDDELMKKIKSKNEGQQEEVVIPSTQQFGVTLQFLEENNPGLRIPRVMTETTDYIKEHGLHLEGIFRQTPNLSKLSEIQAMYNRGEHVEFDNAHLVASVLKAFLRRLPEPLLTFEVYQYVLNITHVDAETRVRVVASVIQKLPKINFEILKFLIDFLVIVVENSDKNRMNSSNLAVVFGPNLIWSQDQQASLFAMGHINTFVKLLIDNHQQLFAIESDC